MNQEQHTPTAKDQAELLPVVLDTIKKIARSYKKDHLSIQTTEIVHEIYLKLVKQGSNKWDEKNAYLAAFAVTMRSFLVDQYRKKIALKRGGKDELISIDELSIEFPAPTGFNDWLDLDNKLTQLEQIDPIASQVVLFRYFVGLTTNEVAEAMEVSPRTVTRKWHFARAWIRSQLSN